MTRPPSGWCVCYIRPHICHREIHATLTEAELARHYNTPETLRAHPRLAKFAAWVAKRPPGFRSKVPGGMRKR
ncbi:MAG: HNH endonuclease [Sulfitobacter sp.]|nr:HNH endonuclease [Sulfitobacter sp.]